MRSDIPTVVSMTEDLLNCGVSQVFMSFFVFVGNVLLTKTSASCIYGNGSKSCCTSWP